MGEVTVAGVTGKPLDFGVFYAPFHPYGQDPTLALEYDLERIEALDRFGFDEAWVGEHHSGGYELIGSPETCSSTTLPGAGCRGLQARAARLRRLLRRPGT
jgi:hypothetical protein